MSIKDMYDYLPSGTADYTGATLSVTPTNILTESGEFNQKIFWHDDRSLRVISFSPATIQFFVEFDFQHLTEDDAGTILDLYANPLKAYGSTRSFYWEHPIDDHTYILRFISSFNRSISSDVYERMSIKTLKCIVEASA